MKRPILTLNYVFTALIFALNFAGTPALKYLFLTYTAFVFAAVLASEFETSLKVILCFCFLEGQGRILWDYQPFFRVAFDLLVGLAIVKTYVSKRKIETLGWLPAPLLGLVALHFFWYVVEIFNPDSIGYVAPLAATKIYIFPFIFFMMLRQNKDSFGEREIGSLCILLMCLITLESLLSLYQLQGLDEFMLAITPTYSAAMKGDVFTNQDFRPFGTTFLPGAVSVYLFLSSGFLFLKKDFSKRYVTLLLLVIALISVTLLLSQVRSAALKFSVVLLGSVAALFFTSPRTRLEKGVTLVQLTLASTALIGALAFFLGTGDVIDLSRGLDRWRTVTSYEKFKSGRAGPEIAALVVRQRLEKFPLGIGPGLTGAASSVSRDLMDQDPVYDRNTFWGYDNLFLSLIVEFGYGFIFYTLLIISLPLLIFKRFVHVYRQGLVYEARVTLVAFIQTSVIVLGNWGAIGLPYNPESFFFWLWTATALNVSDLTVLKKKVAHVSG